MNNKKIIIVSLAVTMLLACVAVISLAMLHDKGKDIKPLATEQAKPKPKPVAKDTVPKPKKVAVRKKAPKPNPAVEGYLRDSDGRPFAGVVVSDSYSSTVTDSLGHYRFIRAPKSRFVWYCIPADCEVPTHSATDNTAMFYQSLTAKRTVYNFTLHRLPTGKEARYNLIVFGDPQITNAFSPYYTGPNDNPIKKSDLKRFTDETMSDVRQLTDLWKDTPVYAISMGDDVQYYGGYNPNLEREIREALGSSRAKVFSVIGNHDQDGKDLYRRKWEDSFGPTDYSFDRGDVHYVCFNNVRFYKGSRYWQPGEITNSQMNWLRDDLRLADKHKKVIVCYHIPLTFGNNPYREALPLNIASEPKHYISSDLRSILHELEAFEGGFELFCGHTHFAINHEVDFEGHHLLEHCHAAACGNIWQSNVNICGTPNGYYVYDIDGTHIADSYYKGTFWPRDKQMSIFRADTDFNGESYGADWNIAKDKNAIVANVFNADSRWRVIAVEDGVEHEMKRINHQGQDAFATGYHHKYSKSVSYWFVSKKNGYLIMNHLYYYEPRSAESTIIIRAIDPYGHVYTASSADAVTEPFFNYAHYYAREATNNLISNSSAKEKE